ncbi:glucosamine-6-phosphate isomerase, putative [Entamoeba invadens IP1]|uniref:Glucosamine-6-phosphate isomerase, putative n=2 Tax=Entamoeba invadens TaxID=33085 RepID=A0A0A1UGG5_ENTIV|nr:glucosamine-6-phosphate isomerase, putative [Entamoeba invadens IP1]ELP94884.1 glucosamine-6-phosphate isomerase, putative [Entamoeba invadens IP1]|eukprot:XP_004261655.1 glucosamine-6-phosphate isomerase, putative [Entamoeba invadens IP1]
MSSPPLEVQIPQPVARDPKLCQNEHIPTKVYKTSTDASIAAAHEIIDLINQKDGKVVLGLATGSTPTEIYSELVRACKNGEVSFKNVKTFNLDEYYPMKPDQFQSYHHFMNEVLFNHIDINRENVHIPDGTCPVDKIEEFCTNYEKQIEEAGGLDLQILGIGRSGHIGFNEPGSPATSKTRKIYLDSITRLDAAGDFFGMEHVPTQAITMGVGTIMKAKRLLLLAFSEGKAKIIAKAIEGESTELCAASLLQRHCNTTAILDLPASSELTYYANPWTLSLKDSTLNVKYDKPLIKQAVVWLALQCNKPILQLTSNDYYNHHLNALLEQCGSSESVNLFVFQSIQDTISGWPSGKMSKTTTRELKVYDHPTLDRKTLYNPEMAIHKKIAVFSPHPDDDVISMGATIQRLCEQGNEVHTVYETSGAIAVWDDDVKRMLHFTDLYAKLLNIEPEKYIKKNEEIMGLFEGKTAEEGYQDRRIVLEIKRIMRETEAVDASLHCGVKRENVHLLNLPFYQTGQIVKNPVSQSDIEIVKKELLKIQPEMIYAAGDLTDPHGTHRKCTRCVLKALEQLEKEGQEWVKKVEIWLYRGAWQEYEVYRADLIVPMSINEIADKRQAIFKHQSQKDLALFPGADSREFWQRAEDRNKNTADLLAKLGFTHFAAAEAFVRYNKSMII